MDTKTEVNRGGSWRSGSRTGVRSATRETYLRAWHYPHLGFRTFLNHRQELP